MKKDTTLDKKIHSFMADKEKQHSELRESVDTLYRDLITSHMQASLMREDRSGSLSDLRTSSMRGMRYVE